MEKFFKLKDGEPTKTYLKMSRVGGAVISAASFVAMVVSFFLIQRTEEDRVCLKTIFCKVKSIR